MWEFYTRRVFVAIPRGAKTTMEAICTQASIRDYPAHNWNMWVYGLRGEMFRDEHLQPGKGGSSYTAATGAHRADPFRIDQKEFARKVAREVAANRLR